MSGYASVPAINQYLRAAIAKGIDYQPMLEAIGLDADCLADTGKLVPLDTMEQLLVRLIEASDDPCFGLNASEYVDFSSYGVLSYIAMNCATFEEAQNKIPLFEKLVGDMGTTEIKKDGDWVLQQWNCRFNDPEARRHEIDHVMGSWIGHGRKYLNIAVPGELGCVWLEHSAPESEAAQQRYREVFGYEVHFDQPASGIRFHKSLLDTPIPQADQKLLQTLLDHATQTLAEIDQHQPTSIKTKNLIRLMLKEKIPSAALIAEKLGMSNRTLQRKLEDEGTSYKEVLNDLRQELALHYLQNTSLSIETIAAELGYSETRSFYRSFKQWTGKTAGSYRKGAAI